MNLFMLWRQGTEEDDEGYRIDHPILLGDFSSIRSMNAYLSTLEGYPQLEHLGKVVDIPEEKAEIWFGVMTLDEGYDP